MSEKRGSSASLSDEETKKKMKFDASSSSGSASAIGTAANEDSLKRLVESRDKANTDSSSLNIQDQHSQTKNMGTPSTSSRALPSSSREEQSPGLIGGGSSEKKLLHKKKLTFNDIHHERMTIPVECVAVLFPGLQRRIILPVRDSKGHVWGIEAMFNDLSRSYVLRDNWKTFVDKHGLRPEDDVFFYQDPKLDYYLIEYEKRAEDKHSQTMNMGTPATSSRASLGSSREKQSPGLIDGESSEKKLLHKKKLTLNDIYHGRLTIPVECVAVLFPALQRRIILSVRDSEGHIWGMKAWFNELSRSYVLRDNWKTFVDKHGLRPEDEIFFYQDPKLDYYLIEYEKQGGNGQSQERVAADYK